MRELTFDECVEISGGGRWSGFFKFLKDIAANVVAALTVNAIEDAEEHEAPPTGFDPTGVTDSGVAMGNEGNGTWWAMADGMTWYDMDGDGVPEERMFISDDGTAWVDNGDNNWREAR